MQLESPEAPVVTSQRILILGGTGEALELADLLIQAGHHAIYSLAGVTANPVLPSCEIRRGGFGGVEGLIDYLRSAKIQVLVDATHPFAKVMSQHASDASGKLGLPLLRLERPAWQPDERDTWICVANMAEAISALPQNAKVLVTTGRKNLAGLLSRADLSGVIRSIEPLAESLPKQWHGVLDRPPHRVAQENEIMLRHGLTHLMSKNAGGHATSAKLAAARANNITVVMIDRPSKSDCPTFANAIDLLDALPDLL